MSAITIKAILQPRWCSSLQFVRFRKRINIQRPAKPHYERARVLEVSKPYYIDPRQGMSLADLCEKPLEIEMLKQDEENPYEQFLAKEVMNWFNNSKMVAFFHGNPIASDNRFKVNIMLKKQNMHLKQYGKKVVRLAVENTKYEAVLQLFTSQNFMVFSPEPQVARLLRLSKKMPQLVLMAGVVDGKLMSKNELIAYSRLPDLPTAQGGVVAVLQSAAANLRQNLLHHQRTLVSHLQKHCELQQKVLNEKDES